MVSPLGTIGLNLRKQFIRFYENGRKYKLQSVNSPPPQIVSSNVMEKMIKKGAQAYFLHCFVMEESTKEDTKDDPPQLEKNIEKYSDMFREPPHGLPPPRSRGHIIELILGSAPIKRKSYR